MDDRTPEEKERNKKKELNPHENQHWLGHQYYHPYQQPQPTSPYQQPQPTSPYQQPQPTQSTVEFKSEYVTGSVSILNGDGIAVHIINDSGKSENVRVIIYKKTVGDATVVTDTGNVIIFPTRTWSLGHTISDSGGYWIRIQSTSELLVPVVSFERFHESVWSPIVVYPPGAFAIYKLHPDRQRVW
jgi:hypothetical protein